MSNQLPFRIILEKPTLDVDYGLQEGQGSAYKTIQTKTSDGSSIVFNFSMKYKLADDEPVFSGAYVHGPSGGRFIYIDIGQMAGQKNSAWSRRIKIPLEGITREMAGKVLNDPGLVIETKLPGEGKDGGPVCGTVRPVNGWKLARTL